MEASKLPGDRNPCQAERSASFRSLKLEIHRGAKLILNKHWPTLVAILRALFHMGTYWSALNCTPFLNSQPPLPRTRGEVQGRRPRETFSKPVPSRPRQFPPVLAIARRDITLGSTTQEKSGSEGSLWPLQTGISLSGLNVASSV